MTKLNYESELQFIVMGIWIIRNRLIMAKGTLIFVPASSGLVDLIAKRHVVRVSFNAQPEAPAENRTKH